MDNFGNALNFAQGLQARRQQPQLDDGRSYQRALRDMARERANFAQQNTYRTQPHIAPKQQAPTPPVLGDGDGGTFYGLPAPPQTTQPHIAPKPQQPLGDGNGGPFYGLPGGPTPAPGGGQLKQPAEQFYGLPAPKPQAPNYGNAGPKPGLPSPVGKPPMQPPVAKQPVPKPVVPPLPGSGR